jgi:anti-sigma-K factor RskA
MNFADNERLLDKLAAEYVLGTLKGGARRRYDALLARDPMVRRATADWQDRLHPMAQFTPAVTPPDSVWRGVARQVGISASAATAGGATSTAGKRSFWLGLRDDLSFWRGLGMVSTALATILVAVLATRPPAGLVPVPATTVASTPVVAPAAASLSYVAMLADDRAQPVAVITGDIGTHKMVVKLLAPQTMAADRSLQLWAVPKTGSPRPLGLVDASGSVTLPLPEGVTPDAVSLLAISLEPKGGSPNPNAPTGPIVYKGAWLQI